MVRWWSAVCHSFLRLKKFPPIPEKGTKRRKDPPDVVGELYDLLMLLHCNCVTMCDCCCNWISNSGFSSWKIYLRIKCSTLLCRYYFFWQRRRMRKRFGSETAKTLSTVSTRAEWREITNTLLTLTSNFMPLISMRMKRKA